jgi:DNA topoisomerase I
LAEPKRGRGQRASAPPLRELGADPVSGAPIVVKDGRYGPYVTDGETNASLPKDETPEAVTLERAADLLADRRLRGPAKRPTKRTAKKTKAKKTAKAKKATTTAKKAATKATKRTAKTAGAD